MRFYTLIISAVAVSVGPAAWAADSKPRPLVVHEAIPVTSPELRKQICKAVLAHLGQKGNTRRWTVVARTETYPPGVDARGLAGDQQAASRKPGDIKRAFDDEAQRAVAKGLHRSWLDHGHAVQPLNAESPYRQMDRASFGVQIDGKEYPATFHKKDGEWVWTVGKPIAIEPALTNAREVSQGVEKITPKELGSTIPSPIQKRMDAFDLSAELTGLLHHKQFLELFYGEAIGRLGFEPGPQEYYLVKDADGKTIGYMKTFDLTMLQRSFGAVNAIDGEITPGSAKAEGTTHDRFRRYAHFDLNGNRVDSVNPASHGVLQGRHVTTYVEGKATYHVATEDYPQTEAIESIQGHPLRTPTKPQAGISSAPASAVKPGLTPVFKPYEEALSDIPTYRPNIMVSADGKYVLSPDGGGSIYDTQTGKLSGKLGIDDIANAIFSDDGKLVYAATTFGEVLVVDAVKGRVVKRIPLEDRFRNRVHGVVTDIKRLENGNLLIDTGGRFDNVVYNVNPRTGNAKPVVESRRALASQKVASDPKLKLPERVRDPNHPEPTGYFERYQWSDYESISKGVSYVVAQSYGNTDTHVYRATPSGHTEVVFPGKSVAFDDFKFIPKTDLFVTAKKGVLTVWNLSGSAAEMVQSFNLPDKVKPVELHVSRDGSTVVYRDAVGAVGSVRLR